MRAVKISEFKAQLAKYLREVRNGQEIEILDRGTPVACVTPIISEMCDTKNVILAPKKRPEDLALIKSKVKKSFKGEVMDILLEERHRR